MVKANDRQVGGGHYKKGGEEHWDRMWRLYGRGYFVGCITKYVERYHEKNGVQDLEKAIHFTEKLIELEQEDGSCTAEQDCVRETAPSTLFADPLLGSTDPRLVENTPYRYEIGSDIAFYKHGEVLPTGWAQFVFEGADQEGYLYTCRECNVHFRAPPYTNPHMEHGCHAVASSAAGAQVEEGAATSAYTNQG